MIESRFQNYTDRIQHVTYTSYCHISTVKQQARIFSDVIERTNAPHTNTYKQTLTQQRQMSEKMSTVWSRNVYFCLCHEYCAKYVLRLIQNAEKLVFSVLMMSTQEEEKKNNTKFSRPY